MAKFSRRDLTQIQEAVGRALANFGFRAGPGNAFNNQGLSPFVAWLGAGRLGFYVVAAWGFCLGLLIEHVGRNPYSLYAAAISNCVLVFLVAKKMPGYRRWPWIFKASGAAVCILIMGSTIWCVEWQKRLLREQADQLQQIFDGVTQKIPKQLETLRRENETLRRENEALRREGQENAAAVFPRFFKDPEASVKRLSRHKGVNVEIRHVPGGDAPRLANTSERVFALAGLNVLSVNTNAEPDLIGARLRVEVPPGHPEQETRKIEEAANAFGVESSLNFISVWPARVVVSTNGPPPGRIIFTIGAKLDPMPNRQLGRMMEKARKPRTNAP